MRRSGGPYEYVHMSPPQAGLRGREGREEKKTKRTIRCLEDVARQRGIAARPFVQIEVGKVKKACGQQEEARDRALEHGR